MVTPEIPENLDLLSVFKALANESRLRLLGLVAQREHSVQELAAAVAISEPTASHHLAMLRETGLVARRVAGTTHWYSFVPDALTRLSKRFLTREAMAKLASVPVPSRGSAEATLANYLNPDGTLKRIPSSRKKRYAVLAWLVRKFEEDRRYSEREVNELLQRHHWDSATLRREFIGYHMMEREKGVYWRTSDMDWRSADGAEPVVY